MTEKPLQFPIPKRTITPPGDPVAERQRSEIQPPPAPVAYPQVQPLEEPKKMKKLKGVKELPLNKDQQQALSTILGAKNFICIGIIPTVTGADFIVSASGDSTDFHNALPHLEQLIMNSLIKKGLW